ncbi:MAG TPA: helix-turn-helix domain-containing protein [Geminicoccaceae bacterium]|nr:helix-turn-helix domain-containing protein [Geminicoccaceae bacterium]
MVLRLRELTAEERSAVDALARSRTAPARRVERARIIVHASQGEVAPAIAERLRLDAYTVRGWIHRFNAEGLAGLEDRPRAGRPPTYAPAQVATVIATALTDPGALDLPFASWTLDRLAAYLSEHEAIAIKRSRIDELLRAEGLRWRKHESWFGARVDPEFAEKRGGSRRSTRPHPRAA